MPETEEIFKQYLGAPVTSQCYKELGQKIQQYPQSEREALFASFQPTELHLQLLKLMAARTSGCHRPLLDVLREESKFLSEFSLKSKLLFNGSNTELFDPSVLIPLLQMVSASKRERILWRLGKYVSTKGNSRVSVADIDTLYESVSKVWGSSIASPLLCQTSEELLKRELPNVTNLSTGHLLIIAKKFPYLALSYLEQTKVYDHPLKAARYIVSKTMPKSFDYVVKQSSPFLTKSMTKDILKNYSTVVLESPSVWLQVFKESAVKKHLTPVQFKLFLTKQFLELEDLYVPYALLLFFKLLSPIEVSSILNKVFPEKYGCSLRSKANFWEKNEGLLKLLDASDRNFIVNELNAKDPLSVQWLPLMSSDVSIPRFQSLLESEQDVHVRAGYVSRLIETALLSNDQSAIEDICKLVANRYRNDRHALNSLFDSDIKFSSLSTETFDLVFALANRMYDPKDWQTNSAAKLIPVAIKRNWGEASLKEFLDHLMKDTPYCHITELDKLEIELRQVCIHHLFTTSNVQDQRKLKNLVVFLPLISEWSRKSSLPLINDNVKMYISTLSKSDDKAHRNAANAFVCANLKSLDLQFVEDCFQNAPDPSIMAHLVSKKSLVVFSEKTLKRVTEHILEFGVNNFTILLKKLKKVGCKDILHTLSKECTEALSDDIRSRDVQICTNTVILLALTSHVDDFFSIIDPLLPITESNQVDANEGGGDSTNSGKYCPLTATKQDDAICYGFGRSIPHFEISLVAVERLQKFCVNGDLVLFVRDALYSVCSSLPNDKAKALLLSLMKQPVSVKKHALRLLWRTVCNIETQQVLLLKFMETEKHLSMRIILMNTVIASLNVSKHVSLWQVLKEILNKLTPNDASIVKDIVAKRLPDQFLEEYYFILSDKCKILKDKDKAHIISTLANQVLEDVTIISERFVEHFIVEFFLSNVFFGVTHYCHSPISELVVLYLQGAPGSKLPISQVEEVSRTLGDRQQFLKERLDACAIDGPCDILVPAQGIYPVRRLLKAFIENFCESCLHIDSKKNYRYQLTDCIDFLLAYFKQFNLNSVLSFYTMLSSTKVLRMNALQSPFVLGEKFGEMCDSMFLKNSGTLFCYPSDMASFFAIVNRKSMFTISQLLDIYRGILATVPSNCGNRNSPDDLHHMLRLVTVAHILPSGYSEWLTNDDYKVFRETFLALIKNTPAEVYLFSCQSVIW